VHCIVQALKIDFILGCMRLAGKEVIDMGNVKDEAYISWYATVSFRIFSGLAFISGSILYLASDKNILETVIYLPLLIFSIYAWCSGNSLIIDDPIKFWLRKAIQLRVLIFYMCTTIYLIIDGLDALYLSFSIIVFILSLICFFIGMRLYDEKLMSKMIKENIKYIDGKLDDESMPGNILLYSFRAPKSKLIQGITGSVFKFVFLFIVFPLSLLGGGAGFFTLEVFRFFLGDNTISPHAIGFFMVCLPASMYFAFQLPALINFKRKWEKISSINDDN
jgi:hypothetical protein